MNTLIFVAVAICSLICYIMWLYHMTKPFCKKWTDDDRDGAPSAFLSVLVFLGLPGLGLILIPLSYLYRVLINQKPI